MLNLRSYALWILTPLTLVAAVFAGISSATAEQAARSVAPPPARPGTQAGAVRPQPYAIAGHVLLIDLVSRTMVVRRLDGHLIDVYLIPRTVVRQSGKTIRPRDIQVGDRVAVVGKPHTGGGLDAAVIMVAPRSASANSPPKALSPPATQPIRFRLLQRR